MGYLLTFGVGLSSMPWVVNSEIYPMQARSLCGAIATGVNWTANLFVSATFLDLADSLSTDPTDVKHHPDGVFWLYAMFGATFGLWLCRKMPETKGLSLQLDASVMLLFVVVTAAATCCRCLRHPTSLERPTLPCTTLLGKVAAAAAVADADAAVPGHLKAWLQHK